MSPECGELSREPTEAVTFNAETHVKFFRETFDVYGIDLDSWCLCIIADNAKVKFKIARILQKPIVGCASHKLNLEINYMVRNTSPLNIVILAVHDVIKYVKTRLRSAATVRNLTDLRPVMHNETRWTGKHHMLKRFIEIKEALVSACENADVEFMATSNPAFTNRVTKYEKMLGSINVVTMELQRKGATISECRDALNSILEAVNDEKAMKSAPLYGCRLEGKYLSVDSTIVECPNFENGVTKILNKEENKLSDVEKHAVRNLRRNIPTYEDESVSPIFMSMRERLAKRRKMNSRSEEYIDCKFILGSVAEAERVWSMAKYVLTNHRRSLTPRMMEAILFLRYNERLWDLSLVAEAVNGNGEG